MKKAFKILGYALLGPAFLALAFVIPLLIFETAHGAFDCKSATIYPTLLVFYGLFPTLFSALIILAINIIEKKRTKTWVNIYTIALIIEIATLAWISQMSKSLKDCAETSGLSLPSVSDGIARST